MHFHMYLREFCFTTQAVKFLLCHLKFYCQVYCAGIAPASHVCAIAPLQLAGISVYFFLAGEARDVKIFDPTPILILALQRCLENTHFEIWYIPSRRGGMGTSVLYS